MKPDAGTSTSRGDAEAASLSDEERMESMKELLADLRASIRTQRHLIDASRALIRRS